MPIVAWSDKYCVGNERIDGQHERIFDIVNEFYSNHDCRDLVCDDTIVIDRLWSYAQYHFQEEERMMIELGYPETHEHIELHRVLNSKIRQIVDDVSAYHIELPGELTTFLLETFLKHIMVEDRKIAEYITATTH